MDAPDFSTVDDAFGPAFLAARKEKGLSQEAVVEGLVKRHIQLHVTAVGKIERGERRVTVGEASALASILGYTLDGLIGGGADLVTSYALLERAAASFSGAWREYLYSLMEVTYTADRMTQPLREADDDWLTHSLPAQTPAMLLRDVLHAMEAKLRRDGITVVDDVVGVGEYTTVLRRAILADALAIEAEMLRRDG